MKAYKTVAGEANDEFIEKRSRFIGYVKPVTSQQEAVDYISAVRSKHWDATHNVYAYVLRAGQMRRYSDDGEPQGTAGMPVLDVLLKEDITDCVVVVTRYFGGILLGTGGLVRAYSHAAKLAVTSGGIITMCPCAILQVVCDYNFYGKLASLIPDCGGFVEDTQFTDSVAVTLKIPCEKSSDFVEKLTDSSNGKFSAQQLREEFSAV